MASILKKSWKEPKVKKKSSLFTWEQRIERDLKIKEEAKARKLVLQEIRRKKAEYLRKIKNNNKSSN